MTTARDIITRALKRIGVVSSGGEVPAEYASDALTALNGMMHSWKGNGIDILHTTYTLASTVNFFVPPAEGVCEYYGTPLYQGTWNASTNTPTLATGTGTEGHVYKVSVAGSTTLDDVTSWSAGDWLVYDGEAWFKGQSSEILEDALSAMLAVRISPDYGDTPDPVLMAAADDGRKMLMAMCLRVPPASFETSLVGSMYSRRIGGFAH